MKKAKAIELLKLAVPVKALTQQEYSDFAEAVNMGIDALEQPTTSDTISRQAVIDALDCINGVEEVLRTLPPAQPKTGRWIYTPGMNEQCSACGQYFPLSYFKDRPFDIKYCPHCGADMRGERKK